MQGASAPCFILFLKGVAGLNLVNAKPIMDNYYELTFEEHDEGAMTKRVSTVNILNTFVPDRRVVSATIDSVELRSYIENTVRTRVVFITNKSDRKIFQKTAAFIVQLHDLAINVKEIIYPGAAVILIEYGTLAVNDESVDAFYTELNRALTERTEITVEVESNEEEEKETKEEVPLEEIMGWNLEDSDQEPFFFGQHDDGFENDDSDFSVGSVEDDDQVSVHDGPTHEGDITEHKDRPLSDDDREQD